MCFLGFSFPVILQYQTKILILISNELLKIMWSKVSMFQQFIAFYCISEDSKLDKTCSICINQNPKSAAMDRKNMTLRLASRTKWLNLAKMREKKKKEKKVTRIIFLHFPILDTDVSRIRREGRIRLNDKLTSFNTFCSVWERMHGQDMTLHGMEKLFFSQ